ncbi:hypothetical protein EKG37_20655 [Robertmurraya yapensis]|uniref:Uncharacterized protein n=1 Tax=Bacillus yapensis TaxID=2492960 RepID=A0A3S0ILF3_9BACI|nr:hypothetical protein [Bacillus yapensis]RTR26720.1 hypothetical protein EKG37_20655 [Bacillus yapensis]TKS93808.1 hypothetical protein FAR12_20660 [Bacillus yapensis]
MLKKDMRIIEFFKIKYKDVVILKGSENNEIKRYLEAVRAEASASMDLDGTITIMINDENYTKSALYEEMAHAIQYKKRGNVTAPSVDYYEREIEVAECLIENHDRLGLRDEEKEQTNINLIKYKALCNDLRGGL